MKLSVRWNLWDRNYAEVTFHDGGTTIESGLLDENELAELASHLREIADELSPISEEL